MQFLLAIFLFVVVIGWLDSRLPWPVAKEEKERL
jgi:hypothetical protein